MVPSRRSAKKGPISVERVRRGHLVSLIAITNNDERWELSKNNRRIPDLNNNNWKFPLFDVSPKLFRIPDIVERKESRDRPDIGLRSDERGFPYLGWSVGVDMRL